LEGSCALGHLVPSTRGGDDVKARGGVRQLTWMTGLSVLILVGFVLPAAGPAHCESIDEALAQLKAVRQH